MRLKTVSSSWRTPSPFLLHSCAAVLSVLALACSSPQEAEERHPLGTGLTQLGTVSPELPVFTPTLEQSDPAVAAGTDLYLVVWAEAVSSTQRDIRGARVRASDGALLDASPILIAQGARLRSTPAVAFDGNHFLVVWAQESDGIFGARVSASSGAVLDVPQLISRGTAPYLGPGSTPDVAFGGGNYLVVWQAAGGTVQGIRVNPSNGQPIEPSAFNMDAGHFGRNARVAYGGGRFLVVWHLSSRMGLRVEAARIDAVSGTLIDNVPLALTAPGTNNSMADVASRGDSFLVVWAGESRLRAGRVRGSDGALLDGSGLLLGEGLTSAPAVSFDGTDYRVTWQGTRAGGRKLFSTQVSGAGVLGEEVLLSEMHLSSKTSRADTATLGVGGLLVAYHQWDAVGRIKLRHVQGGPTQEPCDEGEPTMVLNGPAALTLECGAGTYSDPGAQAFDGCGNPLTVQGYNTGNDTSGPGPLLSAEGTYTVSYSASDSAWRTVNASRTVVVEDRLAPTLTLNGPAHMVHTCNTAWTDPGVTALDACYGNLSNQGWRSGDVNAWAEGTYTLTYHLTDSGGNTAVPVTRTVEVVDCPW